MNNYDLIIVGAGPAGIFTALELLRKSSKTTGPRICLIEKGKPVEKRHCPKDKTGHCVNCKPTCAITTGFSGAGAFSDGKLSLSYQVGGELPELIGEDFAQELINYTDKIYLEFGADPHVEGIYEGSEIKEIRKRAIQAGLQLVDCPIRHLGTEKAQQLYLNIQNYLLARGVEMLFNTECDNILLEGSECKGVVITEKGERRELRADQVVIATGRRGADWLEKLCAEAREHDFATVCVNPCWIPFCKQQLAGSDVKVCTVIGFPLGAMTSEAKAFECRDAIEKGADEIDMVINIGGVKDGDAGFYYAPIAALRDLPEGLGMRQAQVETLALAPADAEWVLVYPNDDSEVPQP